MVVVTSSNSLVIKNEYAVCLNFSRKQRRLVELFLSWSAPPAGRQVDDINKGNLTVRDPGFLWGKERRPTSRGEADLRYRI